MNRRYAACRESQMRSKSDVNDCFGVPQTTAISLEASCRNYADCRRSPYAITDGSSRFGTVYQATWSCQFAVWRSHSPGGCERSRARSSGLACPLSGASFDRVLTSAFWHLADDGRRTSGHN